MGGYFLEKHTVGSAVLSNFFRNSFVDFFGKPFLDEERGPAPLSSSWARLSRDHGSFDSHTGMFLIGNYYISENVPDLILRRIPRLDESMTMFYGSWRGVPFAIR